MRYKGKVAAAYAATRDLPTARERIDALLGLDLDSLSGCPTVPLLREQISEVRERLAPPSAHPPDRWVPRSRRWTQKERRQRMFAARWPDFASECRAEIRRRGGELEITGHYSTERVGMVAWRIIDGRPLAVFRAEGWRKYGSRSPARRARLAYLAGIDESGYWAIRIAGSIDSVRDALGWVRPAKVAEAEASGRRVLRQGDVYAVETLPRYDGAGDLPQSHTWDAETRTLHHEGHGPLEVPFPCRFYRQRAYEMGRSGRGGFAD
jgi:hypothetical protein